MMMADFATQIGVTRLPNLTADGRDGFPSRAQHDWCVEQYLEDMCEKKRGKALVDKSLYDRILAVCFDETNKKTETAQFRWWVRRTFKLYTETHGHYLMHENRPIAVKEQIYDILVYAHAECGHGGRDKTSAAVRRYFSWIPKDVVSRFVSVCPGCHARTQKDDEYFANKGADGYYPVHHKVRELSISRKQATPEDFINTSPYQPLLALGMIKILKALEAVPSDLSSIIIDGPFSISQFSLLPSDAQANASQPYSNFVNAEHNFEQSFHTSHLPLSLSREPLGAVNSPRSLPAQAGFLHGPLQGQNYPAGSPRIDTEPRYTSTLLSAHAHQPYLSQTPVSNAPSHISRLCSSNEAPFDKTYVDYNKENVPLPQGIGLEPSASSNHFTRPQPNQAISVNQSTRSPTFARVAKPLPKNQARKTSSLAKAHKKTVLSEPFFQSPTPTNLTTHAASQSSRQSAAPSEDDNTSKSDLSSPSNYHPVLLPQYSFNSQPYVECAKDLDEHSHHPRMHDQSDVATDHRVDYNMPEVVAFNNTHNNRGYANAHKLQDNQTLLPTGHWSNLSAADQEYRLQDFHSNQGINYSPTSYQALHSLHEHGDSTDASINQLSQEQNKSIESWTPGNRFQEALAVPDTTYSSIYTPLPTETVDIYGPTSNRSSSSSLAQNDDSAFRRYGDPTCVLNADERSGLASNSLGLDFSNNYPLPYDQQFSAGDNHPPMLMGDGLSHCIIDYERENLEV